MGGEVGAKNGKKVRTQKSQLRCKIFGRGSSHCDTLTAFRGYSTKSGGEFDSGDQGGKSHFTVIENGER